MNNNPGSWKNILAKCGLLRYSTVEESRDGHLSITINALTYMEPKPCDEKSKEAASKILSLCEISAIWLTDDSSGIVLESQYDCRTITINSPDLCSFRKENLDKESVQLDQELGEIDWTDLPQVSLYAFLEKIVGDDLASIFLRYCSPGVCLYRVYGPEERKKHLPQVNYKMWGDWGDWVRRNDSKPVWAIVPRKG